MKVKNIFLCAFLIVSLRCSSTAAAEKIRFAIPSRSVSVMPFYIAGQEGFYRDEGLELEMIHMSSQIAVTATLAGSVEFSSTPGPAVNAAVRGVDLKAIFIVAQRPLHDLITSPSVRSFADLKGKVLGLTSMGSMSDNLTRRILRKNGLDPDRDVALRVIGTETLQVAALKNGVIAGALLTVPYNFLAQKDGFRKLAYAGDYEEVAIGGAVATGKFLKEEPQKTLRFLRATLRGMHFYRERKAPSVRHMGKFLTIKDAEFLDGIYDYHRATLTESGAISPILMTQLINDAKRFAKVEREVKKEEAFDFSFLEKAAQEIKKGENK
jgi:NitT/TauT family transport system substrate-binding protein